VNENDRVPEDPRGDRVDELRAKIESGDYSVPAAAVADAILDHFRAKVARPDLPAPNRGEGGLD